jgi:hypothetical protein
MTMMACAPAPVVHEPEPEPPPDPSIHVVHVHLDAAVPDAAIPPVEPFPEIACGTASAHDCDGSAVCVETPRQGDLCEPACGSDGDCRVDSGYVCDPQWHACLLPGFAAITPRRCGPGNGSDKAFGSAALVDTGSAMSATAPAAVLAGNGSVVTVASAGEIIAAGSSALGSGSEPAIARAGETIFAAWHDPAQQVQLASTRDRGATWAPLAAIGSDDCTADDARCPERPRLAATARALYVAYSSDAIGTRVRSSRDSGATWSPATTALVGARGDLAAGADGRIHVIAMRGGTGGAYGAAQHVLEYTVSTDGGRHFAAATTVSAREEIIPAYFANPTLAVDDRRGWIYVAYARGGRDAAWAIVLAASKDKGKTWSRTHVLDDGCALAMVPSLAVDGATGNLHVTWYDTRDVAHGRYAHAICATGGVRCTDHGAIASLLPALGTGRYDAQWVGDSETLVIDERRRLLHAIWAQPTQLSELITTRIVHAAAKLKP